MNLLKGLKIALRVIFGPLSCSCHCCTYPVFPLLFKPLLEPVDLLLQYVDPLRELGGRQLLFLVVAGAKRRTPSATGEIDNNSINFPPTAPFAQPAHA